MTEPGTWGFGLRLGPRGHAGFAGPNGMDTRWLARKPLWRRLLLVPLAPLALLAALLIALAASLGSMLMVFTIKRMVHRETTDGPAGGAPYGVKPSRWKEIPHE